EGGRCGVTLDVPVDGVFEQDGGKNPLACEAGTGDDARAHLMHELKHLIVVVPGVIFDPVKCQRMRCAAAALIQRRDKAGLVLHLLHLLGRSHGWPPSGYANVVRWSKGNTY